jgi:hypothetical protein
MDPATLSLSRFAARHGWHKSRSSQLKKDGHLVLDSKGQVLVAESEALMASLKDPTKVGVAERHQANRSQGLLEQALTPPNESAGDVDPANSSSSARRASALADIAELDRDQRLAKVCDVDAVQSVLINNYVAIRQLAEQIPFEMRPLVSPEAFDILKKKIHGMLSAVSNAANTFADKIRNTEQ